MRVYNPEGRYRKEVFGHDKCVVCSSDFIKKVGNQRFCSVKCRDKHFNHKKYIVPHQREMKALSDKKWIHNNKEHYLVYQRQFMRERRNNPSEWDKDLVRAKDYRSADKSECCVCGSKHSLQVHHKSYFPSITFIMCYPCHKYLHDTVNGVIQSKFEDRCKPLFTEQVIQRLLCDTTSIKTIGGG